MTSFRRCAALNQATRAAHVEHDRCGRDEGRTGCASTVWDRPVSRRRGWRTSRMTFVPGAGPIAEPRLDEHADRRMMNRSMREELEVLKLVTHRLEAAQLPYMVTGSVALGLYAQPRMTRDIDDLVVGLQPGDAERLVDLFDQDFVVDVEDRAVRRLALLPRLRFDDAGRILAARYEPLPAQRLRPRLAAQRFGLRSAVSFCELQRGLSASAG